MAQKSLYQLTLDITANSAKLSQGLAKANNSLSGTGKAASGFGKIMNNVFKEAAGYIDNIIPGFSTFISKLGSAGGAVTGLSKTFNVLKIAIASTGIGLLVIALGTLVSYFKNTEEGGDKFARVLGAIKAVLGEVMQRINLLGEAVALMFKGKFKEAAEKAKEAFKDLGKEIKDASKAGLEAADRRDALEDKEIAFITRQQELQNKIAKAREIYSSEESSIAQKQEAIKEAMAAQNELYNTKKELAQENLDILKLENSTKERTNVEIKAEKEAETEVLAIQEEQSKELRSLNRLQGTISKESVKEAEARADALATLKEQNQAIKLSVEPVLGGSKVDPTQLVSMNIPVATAPDFTVAEQAWVDYKDGTISIWQMIENQALSSFDKIKNAAVDVGGMLSGALTEAVIGLTTAFGNLFAGTEAGFKGVVTTALTAIQQIINAMLAQAIAGMIAGESKKGLVGLITGAIGVAALLALWKSKVPEFASGTNFAPGGLALVGERGAELVNLPRGTKVYNSLQSRSMMASHITVDGVIRGKDIALALRRAE